MACNIPELLLDGISCGRGNIKFYIKLRLAFYFILPCTKSSRVISFCLGLLHTCYSTNDQIALKNLQSDVTERKLDFSKVIHVCAFQSAKGAGLQNTIAGLFL
jgi:hypothetical protein